MLTFQTRQKKYYREEPFIVYYKIITKGMLPIKLNLYIMAHFWETCSQVMSIMLKYLCLAHKKHPGQALL